MNERMQSNRKKFVHNASDAWEITSDIPIDRVPDVQIIDRRLPGRLGSFIYPLDAVFTLKRMPKTTCADFETVLSNERSKRFPTGHLNHISILEDQMTNETTNMSDDDEDESESNDDEGDENCQDEHDSQWDDDDDE